MAVDHVKSAAITSLDGATPPVAAVTGGQGQGNYLKEVSGYATAVASSSADATYQLVRLPSAAKVKEIIFESAAQTAGKFDLGVYYATDGRSGPSKVTALLAAAAIDQDLFAVEIDCAAAVAPTDVTNESGSYTIDKRIQPLWQAAGLSSDPGGYIDIVATVKTTAVTTGTGRFGISVRYTD
jgi:hypothetical protein